MAHLGEWLREHNDRPRVAGKWDCCCFPAAWALANGWPDPMARWRGAYSTEAEAELLIGEAGGLLALFRTGMGDAGIPEAEAPSLGCIGVICVGDEEAGAIYTGKRWALVAEKRLVYVSVEPELVTGLWAVAHG